MKQTAVEWLVEQLEEDDSKIARVIGLKKYNSIIQQAKEMERQQIIKHSVELTKILLSNPMQTSGKTAQELVDNYFKNTEQ